MPVISSKKPYRIGRAKTGLGLFATRPIKKGSKIIRYFGPLLDSKKKEDEAVDNKYLFEINGRWTIDGSVRKNIARYINHACKPNAESDVNARKRKVVIRAIKNIEAGEEINYDYGKDYFKIFLKPIGCKCDACEKKRRKERGEARAEKQRLKLKAERKAAKNFAKNFTKSFAKDSAKDSIKTTEKLAKPMLAKSKGKAAKAQPSAHARGTGKPTKTKAGRTKSLAPRSVQPKSPAAANQAGRLSGE